MKSNLKLDRVGLAGQGKIDWDLLGGLRFALAWIVACHHLTLYFFHRGRVVSFIADLGGKAAVIGFLLVSGFSIAASLARNPHHFYRRRIIRIYPLYIFAMLATMLLERGVHGYLQIPTGNAFKASGPLVAFANCFFLQTFAVKPVSFDGPVWSLAIEVSYYLLAPFLLRLNRRWVLPVLIVVSAISFAAPRASHGVLYFVFTRTNMLEYGWAWFIGFMLFEQRSLLFTAVVAVAGSVLIPFKHLDHPEPYAVITFLLSLFVIALAVRTRPLGQTWPMGGRILEFLGDISYPLYLLQMPVFLAAYAFFGITASWTLLGCAVSASTLAFYAVDVYGKRWIIGKLGGLSRASIPTMPVVES